MKFLRWIGFLFLILIIFLSALFLIYNESIPEGKEGAEAEELTDQLFTALNKPAFDSLKELRWSFPRGHHFIWNKENNQVNVKWKDFEVDLQLNNLEGRAYARGELLEGSEQEKAIQKAWALFANDSFWLIAPYKARDPGTTRSLVTLDGQKKGLLVTYTSGGVTPGDSYLWTFDETGKPKSWKMWVKIIPIGGLEFSWEGWQLYEGAWFAPIHQGPGPLSVDLKNLSIR